MKINKSEVKSLVSRSPLSDLEMLLTIDLTPAQRAALQQQLRTENQRPAKGRDSFRRSFLLTHIPIAFALSLFSYFQLDEQLINLVLLICFIYGGIETFCYGSLLLATLLLRKKSEYGENSLISREYLWTVGRNQRLLHMLSWSVLLLAPLFFGYKRIAITLLTETCISMICFVFAQGIVSRKIQQWAKHTFA